MPHSPSACLPQPAHLGPCEELESSVALLPSLRAGSLHLRPDSGSLRESFAFCVSVCIYVSLFVFVNFLGRRTHSFPPGSRKVSQPFLWRGGATAWTVAYHALLSMRFSRQEYWTGLPFPSPGDLPDPGIEPRSPTL